MNSLKARTFVEHTLWVAAFAIGVFVLSSLLHAQRGAGPAAPRSPGEAAPIDLTGYRGSLSSSRTGDGE